MGATGLVHSTVHAAAPGLTSAHVEKLFFSQESQAVLCWVFGGTEFGISSPPLLPGKQHPPYPACCTVCSVLKQLV